jgi:peptidoglycan/xylan/chitin deacetylase (PgdA/CDA1 family)
MAHRRTIGAALTALRVSRADALLAPLTRGIGVILTLHRVSPAPVPAYAPNRILTITPDYLEQVIGHVLAAGYDVVSLDEMARRLEAGRPERPFCCFTFDDGYRDNRDVALPIFEHHGLPLAIYIAAEYADQTGTLWWIALEEAIRRLDRVEVTVAGAFSPLSARTDAEKSAAFAAVYRRLRAVPEADARAEVARLCRTAGYDSSVLAAGTCMSWDELKELSVHPLVTLGAHTLGHWALAKLPEDEARRQIADGVARLEAETGRRCRHFSYPYGDPTSAGPREFAIARALGMRTAVTTRKSLVHASHRATPTALPRLSLNGDYQDIGQLETLLTGAPFALLGAARRMSGLTRRAVASTI